MEEYIETLKSYPSTSPLTVDAGGVTWTVFYVELSSSGNTVINIPNHQEYSVSGDNIGGFIVAYH
jgi:D-alanyl-D-alanine carboxypeptidase